jgi:hypothetical protein
MIFFKNKWINFLICFCSLFYFSAAWADNICVPDGLWYDASGVTGQWRMMMDEGIYGHTGYTDSVCGNLLVNGEGNNVGLNLLLSYYNPNGDCLKWNAHVNLTYAEDCGVLAGTWQDTDNNQRPLLLVRVPVKIVSPDPKNELVISAEPRMPKFYAKVEIDSKQAEIFKKYVNVQSHSQFFTWSANMTHVVIPGKRGLYLLVNGAEGEDPGYEPDFNTLRDAGEPGEPKVIGGVAGGYFSVSVKYYNTTHDEKVYTIKGTNPGQVAIEQVLTDFVPRQIACQESRYKQFDASREGGIGFPIIGKNAKNEPTGGAGIMQVFSPPPSAGAVWNWRQNIVEALVVLGEKRAEAESAHIKERNRLNRERKAKGLPACPQGVPSKLSPDQLIRETIRRYNCGVEYRWEPRDAPNCEGGWTVYHSCTSDDGADLDYVEKVLHCNINQ